MEVTEIKKLITDAFIGNETIKSLYGLDDELNFEEQFSKASIESILFFAIAECQDVNFQAMAAKKLEIESLLSSYRPHRPNWYAAKALLFQFGVNLVADADYYDNSNRTPEEIESLQVVKYADATETTDKSILYLKVATESNGKKQPLSQAQLTAFTQYVHDVSDAGVRVVIVNEIADEMQLHIDVYYDALILDNTGKRLDGSGDTPVQDAVRAYLQTLEFNGMYKNLSLVDALQKVDGVEIPELKYVASKYGNYAFSPINAREIAYAGYYQITDSNLQLNFIPYDTTLL